MIVRLLSASLLLATAATAQNDPPAAKPAAEAPSQEGQGQDPGAVLSQLKAEKERLQREIAYAKQRAANANQMLAQKLARTEPQIASIDAGITRPARPQPMQINKATMMSADARQEFGADALIAVDGTPVKQAEFDTMMEYMRTLENTGDDAMRGQRIMFELIRTNSVASKFPQNNALEQAKVVQKAMAGGTTAAELVKTNAAVLGAQPDGSVTITRNSFLGTGVEMAAFALAEGEISEPIRNVFGYVVLQCEKFEKGSTKELDKIQAKAVQVRFSDDEEALNTAQANASRGQVEIQVRDEATMSMLPAMYRPAPAVPGATRRAARLADEAADGHQGAHRADRGRPRRHGDGRAEVAAEAEGRARDRAAEPAAGRADGRHRRGQGRAAGRPGEARPQGAECDRAAEDRRPQRQERQVTSNRGCGRAQQGGYGDTQAQRRLRRDVLAGQGAGPAGRRVLRDPRQPAVPDDRERGVRGSVGGMGDTRPADG